MTTTQIFLTLIRAGTPPDRAGLAVGWSRKKTREMTTKHRQTIDKIQDEAVDAVIIPMLRG